ncbi:MAG: F0F1 ATP synthase subunit B [Alphaproteobacteria bacterium]|nr:F0F1 ATP synthase subunit B [Alphaproteobacteria bacterium]MDD9919396.1 F0F1 ATP synthase subunit B [Alphaproteobacteria bacterium]
MAVDAHAAATQGMDLFNTAFLHSQIFWTAVAFGLMMFIMAWKVLPVITAILDERAERIRNDLDTADAKRQEAELSLAAYEKKLAEAKGEASDIVSEARVEAKKLVDARLGELEDELKRRRDEATKAIEATKAQAMKELQGQVAELAVQVTEKLLTESVDAKKAEKLTNQAVKNLVN